MTSPTYAEALREAHEKASLQQLQRDLDKYRGNCRRYRAEIVHLLARLNECRAKYLALQDRYRDALDAKAGK